ncbi:UNVERIFIED_CONTAM: Retrovirus-related Pol polyprotein from transposon RE2 [Sesamum calycinum]|uniref:Retrovirus-related Pol polyprotein from transposon RE2 n=1 Tax=Sesamum calycinum TaxID=2727403 RepID=A0AAW2S9N6_9LAMI
MVYKTKFKPNGEVERYKARLVAKGFTQVEGVDFHETFAPIVKLVIVRCLLVVVAKKNWEIHQLDANNAFLHGDLDEEVYMRNDAKKIQEVKVYLNKNFNIKDLGPLKYLLGIEVARSPRGIVLSQRKYTLDILQEAGMLGCKPSSFLMEQKCKLKLDHDRPRINAARYRRSIGRLLYLTLTRLNIAFAVNALRIMLTAMGNSTLEAYYDANWGGCQITRRSCIVYFITLGGSPISCRTKKQTVVAKTSEAEYNGYDKKVQSKEIMPKKIFSAAQLADISTKALGKDIFKSLLVKLSIADLHAPTGRGVMDGFGERL